MDACEDQAWLMPSRFSRAPLAGSLVLAEGRLRFTLAAEAAGAPLEWLERRLSSDGLADRLARGEEVVVFDLELAACEVSWPLTGGGAMMLVNAPECRWVVSCEELAESAAARPLGLFGGRRRAREWKLALAGARPDPDAQPSP